MYLSREEEAIARGEAGETKSRMIGILIALGDIYGAERLIPVRSVQIAGVSYKNIGQAGLEWISDLQGTVVVPSILNPAGMDLCRWADMGIDPDFAIAQKKVVEAYERLGVSLDCTCTPYQIYSSLASYGDHLAWSESSAVSFANSVIGARTNREGGPSALAAALIGKTPLYGYHLDECRRPTHLVEVDSKLKDSDWGALGILVGRIVQDGVPFFRLEEQPTEDGLKALGAAMAASGSVALYYVENATPKPPDDTPPEEKITISKKDIQDVYDSSEANDADIVCLGCPHASREELKEIAHHLFGRKVTKELWICTSRKIAESNRDIVEIIENSGAVVLCDTCMVVSPAARAKGKIMVNSGKALVYLPGMAGAEAVLAHTRDCINAAVGRP